MDDNDPASGTDHDGRRIFTFYADEPPEWRRQRQGNEFREEPCENEFAG